MRVVRLLADRGRRLEADEEQDAEKHAAEHAAARDGEERRLARIEHGQRDPVRTALRDDHDARISIGTNETAANVSIARTARRTPR